MPTFDIPTLQAFLSRGLVTASLAGVSFWINPDTYQETSQRIKIEVPTRVGMGRFSYGVQPNVYTMQGTTGLGGLGALMAMELFRPKAGAPDTLWPFTYPNRFPETRYVYVNTFTDSIKNDTPFNFWYEIELSEYPQVQLQSSLPDTMPPGLLLPVSG